MGIINALRRKLNQRRGKVRGEGSPPSILDYANNDRKLKIDMGGFNTHSRASTVSRESEDLISIAESSTAEEHVQIEWKLPLVDKDSSEPQTMEDEIKRLKALADYFILDQEGEVEFDRIQDLASQMFDAPMAAINLIDLGRLWNLPRVGAEGFGEIPRNLSVCAHVVVSKHKYLVVPDIPNDFRFKENPLVKSGDYPMRFYAGVALISPEGYKLGVLCIISPEARPEGLTESQIDLLLKLGDMVVSTLVARRNRLLKEEAERRFQELGKTMSEASQSLDACREVAQKIMSDASGTWGVDSETATEISSLSRKIGMVANVCSASARNAFDGGSSSMATPSLGLRGEEKREDSEEFLPTSSYDDIMNDYARITNPTTNVNKLFENLNTIVPSFPFHGEVTLEVEKRVPKEIVAEDLLLFRSTLNMLTHCMSFSGPDVDPLLNKSGLRIRRMKRETNELLLQCLQAGSPTDSAHAKVLFKQQNSLLGPVATMVRSMGGRYGMYHGKWNPQSSDSHSQSIFWFQIPYELVDDEDSSELEVALKQTHFATERNMSKDSKKLDAFESTLLGVGCSGY